MSLILCRQEKVEHPYYIENLGIHIYSSQELCYVIVHHPLLVLDGFVDAHLIEFIRNELDMGFTALKMERWNNSGEDKDELLFMFLQECDYYHTAELNKFRQKITGLRKLPSVEYSKKRGDYLFHYKQFGKAISEYEKLLEGEAAKQRGAAFLGSVWNNLGAAYARIFHFPKAYEALDQAYSLLKDETILKKIYHVMLLDPKLVIKESYHGILTDERKSQWDQDFEDARERAQASDEIRELDGLFHKDSMKRMEGAGRLIHKWKQDYRNMA